MSKKLGQEPAFPVEVSFENGIIQECKQVGNTCALFPGISKRLYLAGMAMQGLLSNPDWVKSAEIANDFDEYKERVSNAALEFADELLKQESE